MARKKTTGTTEIAATFVPLFWPFSEFFGDYMVGAISPVLIMLYGQAGVGKSQFALACAEQFARHNWDAEYMLTERARMHITARPPGSAVRPVFVPPQNVLEFAKERVSSANRSKRPLFLVIDSLAHIHGDSNQIGARFHAFIQLSACIHKINPCVPFIVLAIAQWRQRSNPMSPFIPLHRPSISDSLKHHFHVITHLQVMQGQLKMSLTGWSAMVAQHDDTGMHVMPYLESFGLVKETLFVLSEMQQRSMPPKCYEITVPVWGTESI